MLVCAGPGNGDLYLCLNEEEGGTAKGYHDKEISLPAFEVKFWNSRNASEIPAEERKLSNGGLSTIAARIQAIKAVWGF